VAQEIMDYGYANAHPLHGGFEAWRRAGFPVEPK